MIQHLQVDEKGSTWALTEEYIDLCIARADANSDGRIDLDEFVHLLVMHLPDARIAADAEFTTDTEECIRLWSQERAQRLAKSVVVATLDRIGMQRLAICTSITLGAAMIEATLFVNFSHPAAFFFILRYAAEQLLPSLVWLTQDAALVADAMGYSPEELLVLHMMDPAKKAGRMLAAGQCHAVRSVAAGFGLLGQVFQIAQITTNTRKQFDERVRLGEEPPLSSGANERVIRLCGDFSYVTYTTASKQGKYHVLPVLDPSSMRMLAEKVTFGFRYPLFLGVQSKLWGQPEVWQPLLGDAVQPSWLLDGPSGRKILCIEVDGTERREILLFGRTRKIGIAQASNAFRAISSVVLQSLQQQGVDAASIRLLRVYLGDSHELAVTGAGARYTCRERVQSRCEADVLVDFHAPILQRLRLWALDFAVLAATSQDDPFPTFCFETSCPERFQNVAHLMRDTAQVVDQVSAVRIQKSMGQPLPRLIHYPSTAETVNAAYALARLEKYGCDPTQTLVLCERDWGAKQVRELNAGFQVLSAADVIDDLLREEDAKKRYACKRFKWHEMDVRSLNHLDYNELQAGAEAQLQERGLDTSGKKFTLVERLSAAMKAEERRPAAFEESAICDPYLDPYFFGTQEASSDQKMHRRSRSRSPRA
ncbi:unnamed protein product [Symbiodinium sp. KB8]|nr:unnamed protein product [Symbiodinium sp. KB8]